MSPPPLILLQTWHQQHQSAAVNQQQHYTRMNWQKSQRKLVVSSRTRLHAIIAVKKLNRRTKHHGIVKHPDIQGTRACLRRTHSWHPCNGNGNHKNVLSCSTYKGHIGRTFKCYFIHGVQSVSTPI